MKPAARTGDPTGHPGVLPGPGAVTVLIGGQPAAVMFDTHACSMPPLAGPHPPTPTPSGSSTVFINNRPALRLGDTCGCGAPIIAGLPTVLIGG